MLVLSLCLHLSSLSLYLLIVVAFVINYGLKCFTYLVITYIHHSAHCLCISLCWYCQNWGSKHSLVFYTLIELSIGIRAGALAVVSLPKCDPRPLSYG